MAGTKENGLLYRMLGSTGLKVSQLGFGAMRLPMTGPDKDATVDIDKAAELMHRSFELGVNYVDSAVFYCNSDSQRAVGQAIKGWRDKLVVSTKNDYKGADEAAWHKNLNDSLRLLDVQCIDVYNIHGASWQVWQETIEPAISKWLLRARDQGLIKHICCSCHDAPANMIKLMDTGFFESFTVQYNLLDRRNEGAIAHAAAKGIGIVVMGPLAGGRIVTSQGAFNSVVPGQDDVTELALRFVLANPGVSLAISGMESLPIIEQNARVAGLDVPLTKEQYAALDAHLLRLKAAADLYCSGCNYCQPCPQNVRIPQVFSLYNLARVYANWPVAQRDYDAILHSQWDPQGRQADACNECGACEKKCPQRIPIRQQLKDAHQALKVKVK